jgi:hypothetical protein
MNNGERMAAKYKFSWTERFAVWQTHDFQCFWCGEPIRLQDVTIDHIIPEHLTEYPTDLAKTIKLYELGNEFLINDFCNWVPCHGICNSKKNSGLFKPSPAFLAILHGVAKKAQAAKKMKEILVSTTKIDKLIGKLGVAIEAGTLKKSDLVEIFDITHPAPKSIEIDGTLHCFHLPPDWTIVQVDKSKEIATVVSGNISGITSISKTPHSSWQCFNCGHFGPWSGVMCMSCGHKSDGE